MDYPPRSLPIFAQFFYFNHFILHQNLSFKFAGFIFTVYFEASNSYFCFSQQLCSYFPSQFIQPQPTISFMLSTIIFINQTCLFANNSFSPVLSTPSFFFQTIFLSQQPFPQPAAISIKFLSFQPFNHVFLFSHPPLQFFW